MKVKRIGSGDSGINIILYDSRVMSIREFLKGGMSQIISLTIMETKELKKFLDENLK